MRFTRRSLLLSLGAVWASPLHAQLPRAKRSQRVRMDAASLAHEGELPAASANADETEIPRYAVMYSKGLPHNRLGEVEPAAYEMLLRALRTSSHADFEQIPCAGAVKLTNPEAALSFNLVGPDPAAIACPPAPRFSSAGQAKEMIELYWQAAARDIPFAHYQAHPLIQRAAAELGCTPRTIFRGNEEGPYISQFLLKEIAMPPFGVIQKFRSAPAGSDHLGDYERWLAVQNGATAGMTPMDETRCWIRNGRDLAEYVHRDFSYQIPLSAALVLLKMGARPNPGHPYAHSKGQTGFTTFGGPHLLYLIATVAHAALTACWFQKWMVHRRLRPEELSGRLANHLARRASYPIHESLLHSVALSETLSARSSPLLTTSYAEGSPTHPAYPAGHAVLAAAGTTVLKSYFDETQLFPEPFVPRDNGMALHPWDGAPLTLRGELDKLAMNIGMGRCFAGIHWRSDVEEGLRLGEEVAIRVLREIRLTTNEPCDGLRFHRIDGRTVTV